MIQSASCRRFGSDAPAEGKFANAMIASAKELAVSQTRPNRDDLAEISTRSASPTSRLAGCRTAPTSGRW